MNHGATNLFVPGLEASLREYDDARGKYLREFFQLRCASDLLLSNVFPNVKELTESFGAFAATVWLMKRWGISRNDPRVEVICIGDGTTPRTGLTVALRSKWTAVSVDPKLGDFPTLGDRLVSRLRVVPEKAEVWLEEPNHSLYPGRRIVLLSMHSHAPLDEVVRKAVQTFRSAPTLSVVACPCCVEQDVETRYGGLIPPDYEYRDLGIWSPKNLIRVWENVLPAV